MTVWVTPRTWTDGEVVTAAELNAGIRDNLSVLRSGPIGSHIYDPASAVTVAYGTTVVTLDPTNLSVAFTVPDSGVVIVVMSAFCLGASSASTNWLLKNNTTVIGGSDCQMISNTSVGGQRCCYRARITGLSAGSSVTLSWAAYGSSGTGNLIIGGVDGTSPCYGPALMEVYAA